MRKLNNLDIALIIINILIILIALYLVVLIIISKSFNKYQCYNMIIFSFIIIIDNILRIIPFNSDENNCSGIENLIAFFIVFFDKLILATLSMQSLILYFLAIKADFFKAHQKAIFLVTLSLSLIISGTLSLVYIIKNGTIPAGIYCYCNDQWPKKLIDDIFNGVYLFISLFCSIITLMLINREKNEAEEELRKDLNHLFNRNLILIFLNTLVFIESYLIIYDKFGDYTDLIYLITCLVIELFNSINETMYKETLKLFCKKKYKKKYGGKDDLKEIQLAKGHEEGENEADLESCRTESFD